MNETPRLTAPGSETEFRRLKAKLHAAVIEAFLAYRPADAWDESADALLDTQTAWLASLSAPGAKVVPPASRVVVERLKGGEPLLPRTLTDLPTEIR